MALAFNPLHAHVFDLHNPTAERRTRQVMWLTAAMMVVEIIAGTRIWLDGPPADGWHMSSHALALGVSSRARSLLRAATSDDPRFAFGTWKIEVLGGYHQRGVADWRWPCWTRGFEPGRLRLVNRRPSSLT